MLHKTNILHYILLITLHITSIRAETAVFRINEIELIFNLSVQRTLWIFLVCFVHLY